MVMRVPFITQKITVSVNDFSGMNTPSINLQLCLKCVMTVKVNLFSLCVSCDGSCISICRFKYKF